MKDSGGRPRLGRMLGRAALRRCPLCGSGGLYDGWVEPRAACPGCGLKLDRGEEDFFLGGFTLNFIAVELLIAGFLLASVLLTWPAVPWDALLWIAAPLVVAVPILLYPVTRTIWLAIDLAMRPPGPADFREPGGDAAHGQASDAWNGTCPRSPRPEQEETTS